MHKNRLEAFSDGVVAIIITIMVLEIKVPHETTWEAAMKLAPTFLSYVLSFVYVGVYWNSHHHLFAAVRRIDGPVLWANHFLLFWLSLVPFVTGWMGENHFGPLPTAAYGFVLFMSGCAYMNLVRCLVKIHPKESDFVRLMDDHTRGIYSIILYATGIGLSFWQPMAGCLLYIAVAIMWFMPYRSVEKLHQP
jgi:uncharacterized membrane protein